MRPEIPDCRPMTRSEVERLEDGEQVVITWYGGNGPGLYTIRVRDGLRFATTSFEDGRERSSEMLSYTKHNLRNKFIGEYPLTTIRRVMVL